ncbi:hypothetical protein GEMRC1_006483 [Eukaryota sp. GEM-RC1]
MQPSILSLSYILYDKEDIFSFFAAFCTLVPIGLLSVWFYLSVIRQETFALCGFIGFWVNEGINILLKNYLQQARPLVSDGLLPCPKTDFGLPSSHAQFMMFWAVLSTYYILTSPPRKNHLPTFFSIPFINTLWFKLFLSFGAHFAAIVVGVGRVYVNCHSTTQVVVGFGVGSVCGLVYVVVMQKMMIPGIEFLETKVE